MVLPDYWQHILGIGLLLFSAYSVLMVYLSMKSSLYSFEDSNREERTNRFKWSLEKSIKWSLEKSIKIEGIISVVIAIIAGEGSVDIYNEEARKEFKKLKENKAKIEIIAGPCLMANDDGKSYLLESAIAGDITLYLSEKRMPIHFRAISNRISKGMYYQEDYHKPDENKRRTYWIESMSVADKAIKFFDKEKEGLKKVANKDDVCCIPQKKFKSLLSYLKKKGKNFDEMNVEEIEAESNELQKEAKKSLRMKWIVS